MDKYNRNYRLSIQGRDGRTIILGRPFTVEFDIHRNSFSSANAASIRIMNLNKNTRNLIRKDQFDFDDIREISFAAGYGEKLSLAFKGHVSQAWSVRQGTEFITQIESFDGGYAYINAITNKEFPGGTKEKAIIDSLASSLPGVTKGAIGNFPEEIGRGNSFSGNTTKLLSELSGDKFFIDSGIVNCLADDECLDGDIPIINAQSGLLGTPMLEQQYITFDMLFEPSLRVAQLVRLESQTAEHFTGIHKVISIKHRGVISESVSGAATTSVGLLPGTFTPVGFK